MTVGQLKTFRSIVLASVCAIPVAALWMVPRSWWALPLVAMLALMLVMRQLLVRMLKRLNHVGMELLDPEQLAREAEDLYRILRRPATGKNRNFIHRFEALLYELRGEFGAAEEHAMQIAFGHPGMDDRVKWDLARLYLRQGKPAMAQALIRQLMQTKPAFLETARASQLHILGLNHLEQGDCRQAEERLQAALGLAAKGLTRLNCLYDLARFYGRQGETEKALLHYRLAAELGPKTWLGRESMAAAGGPSPRTGT